jgi:hypothetical protein
MRPPCEGLRRPERNSQGDACGDACRPEGHRGTAAYGGLEVVSVPARVAAADETHRVIAETLSTFGLAAPSLEGHGEDRSLSEAIPLQAAKELARKLQEHGLEVSVARDNDDRDLAWVYVAEPSEADAMRDGE